MMVVVFIMMVMLGPMMILVIIRGRS
jgi:hypothetical protein